MKTKIFIYPSIVLGLVLITLSSCEPDKPTKPGNPLNGKTTAIFNPDKAYGKVTDIDGNIYKTIQIGDQTWMAENLRTTRYRNGDSLPNVVDTAQWANLYSGAFCNYNNTNSLDTIATYGRLYNWYAVADDRGLAPRGWHVADAHDWNILFDFLGGDVVAADKLMEVGKTHWITTCSSDNSSGFTALPGGFRWYSEKSEFIGSYSNWWTSSELNENSAAFLYVTYCISHVYKDFNFKRNGYSVRCVKD